MRPPLLAQVVRCWHLPLARAPRTAAAALPCYDSIMEAFKASAHRRLVAAGAAVVALGLVGLGRYYDLDKSEWAAWVQALGSVGAIFGSYLIGRWQSEREDEHAQRMALVAKREKWAAVKAVIDDIYRQCLDLAPHFEGPQAGIDVEALALHYDRRKFTKSLERVESIPVFELNSDSLASPIIDFQREARRVGRWVDAACGERDANAGDEQIDAERVKHMAGQAVGRLRVAYGKFMEITGL